MEKVFSSFVILLFCCCNIYSQSDSGLTHYWKYDEESGNLAEDFVTNNLDTIHYIFTYEEPFSDPIRRNGIFGRALDFDGFSNWIEISNTRQEPLGGDFSISVWVAPRAFEHGQGGKLSAIINLQNLEKKEGFCLGLYRHGSWSFQYGTGDKWIEVWDEGNPLLRQQWSFLTVTYEAKAGRTVLYLNGKPVSKRILDESSPVKAADGLLLIGRHSQNEKVNRGDFPLNMFNGLMDELRIYNRGLSSNEVNELYKSYTSQFNGQIPQIPLKDIMIDRAKYRNDPYRPEYHASPPGHWMNEPHAPFFYSGKYHMNYQFNPTGPYWAQIHWGHWASDDMVHWYDLRESIFPENDTIAPDGIWSGSATYDKNGIPVLFYTFGNWSKGYNQGVAMATPEDITDTNLMNWVKYPEPTITQKPGQAMMAEFRDPFAWKDYENENKWYMLVGSGKRGPTVSRPEGTAWFYESDDLKFWQLKGEFYKTDFDKYPELAGIWELPVLLPIGKYPNGEMKYIFMCSPVVRGLNIWYLIGNIDKQKFCFVPDNEIPQQMNYGRAGFTAPSGMVDPKTGRVIVFTLSHGGKGPAWSGNMGLPVEISLDKDNDLIISPIKELEDLRKEELVSIKNSNILKANNVLRRIGGDMLEILLEIDPMNSRRCGIKVRKSPDGSEETVIYYNGVTKNIGIDGTNSTRDKTLLERYIGQNMKLVSEGPLSLKGEHLKLHIYIDKSMLEVYANSRKAITTRTYPGLKESVGLEVFSDGKIKVKSLHVWELKSIYY